MADSHSTALSEVPDEADEYQSIEPWTVIALLFALVSPVALVVPVLWLVPLSGIVASVVALVRLSRERRPGRLGALVALALSVFFLAVPLAKVISAHVILSRQARPVADEFFALLRANEPQQALMLTFVPQVRRSGDDGLWLYYRSDNEMADRLRKFVSHPVIRTLLALGDQADIRFYSASGAANEGDLAQADLWYTVTYTDENGRKKTFLVSVLMERKRNDSKTLTPWRVRDFAGGIDPR